MSDYHLLKKYFLSNTLVSSPPSKSRVSPQLDILRQQGRKSLYGSITFQAKCTILMMINDDLSMNILSFFIIDKK